MLKYILLLIVATVNLVVCLIFLDKAERELYAPLRTNHYVTSVLAGLTAITTFIAAILP